MALRPGRKPPEAQSQVHRMRPAIRARREAFDALEGRENPNRASSFVPSMLDQMPARDKTRNSRVNAYRETELSPPAALAARTIAGRPNPISKSRPANITLLPAIAAAVMGI